MTGETAPSSSPAKHQRHPGGAAGRRGEPAGGAAHHTGITPLETKRVVQTPAANVPWF